MKTAEQKLAILIKRRNEVAAHIANKAFAHDQTIRKGGILLFAATFDSWEKTIVRHVRLLTLLTNAIEEIECQLYRTGVLQEIEELTKC